MARDNYQTDLLTLAELVLMVFNFFATVKFPPSPESGHTHWLCLFVEGTEMHVCPDGQMERSYLGCFQDFQKTHVRSDQRVACYVHDFEKPHLGSQPAVITDEC